MGRKGSVQNWKPFGWHWRSVRTVFRCFSYDNIWICCLDVSFCSVFFKNKARNKIWCLISRDHELETLQMLHTRAEGYLWKKSISERKVNIQNYESRASVTSNGLNTRERSITARKMAFYKDVPIWWLFDTRKVTLNNCYRHPHAFITFSEGSQSSFKSVLPQLTLQ